MMEGIRVLKKCVVNNQNLRSILFVSTLIILLIFLSIQVTAAENLLTNPGFEIGSPGDWFSYGDCSINVVQSSPHSGNYCAYVSNRTEEWNGVAQELVDTLVIGNYYNISAWVKLEGSQPADIIMTMRRTDNGEENFDIITLSTINPGQWVEISGAYEVTGSSLSELQLYVEGPPVGTNFYVDDLSVIDVGNPENWKEEANNRIEEIRKRDVRIRVIDQNNNPLNYVDVTIDQKKHHFAFGSALSIDSMDNQNYTNFFRENFEWTVFENAAKWYANESSQGNVNYSNADRMYQFCVENDIKVRGHCIFWAVDDYVPGWVQNLNTTQLRQAVDSRLESAVHHWDGKFLHWDVNNEMLHGDFFVRNLGQSIRSYMYKRTRELDPDIELFVNDYNVISYSETDAYVNQIQNLLNEGTPIDGIGVQGHYSSDTIVDPIVLKSRLDRLAQFDLPIWVSEYDSTKSDVQQRADDLEALYRVAFSHPSVEGIMMWGFWAGDHWRGSEAAIVDQNWTINTAGRRYQQLMGEWTTSTSGQTDSNGIFEFRGFHGNYDISISVPGQQIIVSNVDIEPGEGVMEFVINIDGDIVEPGIAGDLNGDQLINSSDYVLFQRYLIGIIADLPVENDLAVADLNKDGSINSVDYVLLRRYLLGLSEL